MKEKLKYRRTPCKMPILKFLKTVLPIALLFFAGCINAGAQPGPYKLTGQVLAALDNSPVIGANVLIKGTQSGTISDLNGNFELQVPADATLIVSFIGYLTEEIAVEGKTEIKITLTEDITSLDEVVVIGYGVQKKKLVTGATSQVKGTDVERLSTTNVLQALQGQTSGVSIMKSSGQPGEGTSVTIRGLGTTGNGDPLYIVDGVQTGDIKYLNSADIESIDILKDAASAAIYGSRAANGVILISTRSGKQGKSQITFDAYRGVQNLAKKVEMLEAREWAVIMNEQHLNSGGNVASLPFDINNLPAYTSKGVANTDWLDEMFVKNAVTQNYALGATGGSALSTYSFSLSYTGQEGIVGGPSQSNYDRYGARLNSEHLMYNDKLKVGEHLNFTYIQRNGIGVGDQYSNTLRGAFNASPLIPVYDDNGEFFNTENIDLLNTETNPYAGMVINNQNRRNNQKLLGDIYAELEIIKNLKYKVTFGIDYFAEEYRSFTPIYRLSIYSFSDYTRVTQNLERSLALNLDNILSYKYTAGVHQFDAMVGMSTRSYQGSFINGQNTHLSFNDLKHAWLNNATNEDGSLISLTGAPYDEDKLLSYFGRIQYNYDEKYLFNFTMRADGSSKFAKGNQWGYFPSVSAGWVISSESFMEPLSNVTNYLKLRASWGQNGNQAIPAFQYMAPISFTQATYAFGNAEGVNTPGSYPSRLGYPPLKWETSEQLNFGFDSRFINSKLSVTFDWYKKSSIDWLINAPILATFGTDSPVINGGKVINSGIELALTFNSKAKDFNYSLSANGTYNKNEVQDIPTNDKIIHGATNTLYNNSSEFYRAEAGHPIGYFWGFETNGIFQNTGEVLSNRNSEGTVIQPDAVPGDLRYVDQNDDGRINNDDKIEIGDPNPDFIFGITLAADYKGFDFQLVANGVAGNQIVQSYRSHTNRYSNYTTAILDRWTGEGTSNEIPRVTNSNINYLFSDIFIHNGDYLRINNITLGYDFAPLLKMKSLGQLRLYASVQNLYTFTRYDGMDPEIGYGFDNGITDQFSSGIDLGFYPSPRTILAGISVKF